MNNDKVYIQGVSAKEIKLKNGPILKLGINKQKFLDHLESIEANEKGYINIGISARREEGKYGETHTVWLDTWKPDGEQRPARNSRDSFQRGDGTDDELPV